MSRGRNRSPRYDRQITVEQRQSGNDATFGAPTVTWVALVYQPGSPQIAERFWANVEDVLPSKDETIIRGVEVARRLTRIRMRWRNDITADMLVTVHGDSDVRYQIVGGPALVGGRGGELELLCERISS